jgi:hypothetical protein
MRPPVDEQRIRALARELGRAARGCVRVYDAIEAELYRYPAIDPPAFRRKLDSALRG